MGLTNGWGDEIDEELKNKKELKVGFCWNFISTSRLITQFDQEVGEVNDTYPKSEIEKMWFSTLAVMVIFELFFHSVLIIIGLPFWILYGMNLFKLSKLFKRFNYKVMKYWILAVIIIGAGMVLNYFVWTVLPGM